MPPLRAAEELGRKEVAAYLPYQRVYLKYPGTDLWHERLLAVRGAAPQDWIVITPALVVNEEDIRAAGGGGFGAGAWGRLPVPLRTLRVFRFDEVEFGEHWETLRAEVAGIAERIAEGAPTVARLPHLRLFGPRRGAPPPQPTLQVPPPPLPPAPSAGRPSNKPTPEVEGRSGGTRAEPQEKGERMGDRAGQPTIEEVRGKPYQGDFDEDELRERLAEEAEMRAVEEAEEYENRPPWYMTPEESRQVEEDIREQDRVYEQLIEGRQRVGGLTTMTPGGAASGGGGGYRGRGRGRG
jgi:hypothetical protein